MIIGRFSVFLEVYVWGFAIFDMPYSIIARFLYYVTIMLVWFPDEDIHQVLHQEDERSDQEGAV